MTNDEATAAESKAAAKAISEALLARSGEALRTGDFAEFEACFLLPQSVATFEGKAELTCAEDLRGMFDRVRQYLEKHNITDLVRRCSEAQFRDRDTVVATHVSRMLSGTELQVEPYPVLSILRRTEEGWKVAHSQYAIPDDQEHAAALLGR